MNCKTLTRSNGAGGGTGEDMRRRCSTPGGVMLGVDMVGLWVGECIMGATITGQYRDVDLARLS